VRQKKEYTLLTEVELEFMTAIWKIDGGTVREVLALLSADRNLAYTSASTILRILQNKGFLAIEKAGRSFIYRPTIKKSCYQTLFLNDLSTKLFDNAPLALVERLVETEGVTKHTLEEMRGLLDQKISETVE